MERYRWSKLLCCSFRKTGDCKVQQFHHCDMRLKSSDTSSLSNSSNHSLFHLTEAIKDIVNNLIRIACSLTMLERCLLCKNKEALKCTISVNVANLSSHITKVIIYITVMPHQLRKQTEMLIYNWTVYLVCECLPGHSTNPLCMHIRYLDGWSIPSSFWQLQVGVLYSLWRSSMYLWYSLNFLQWNDETEPGLELSSNNEHISSACASLFSVTFQCKHKLKDMQWIHLVRLEICLVTWTILAEMRQMYCMIL